jgi:prepilin-type N-terminal cleavage/methylation domain-containing protein
MINKKTYRGVTFVEMIVTIAVTSIVMTGASLFFVKMWTTHHFVFKSGVASFIASRAVEDAVSMMRKAQQAQNGAFPIELADDHEFEFYADFDDDGIVEKVKYFVEDSTFKREVTEPGSDLPPVYNGSVEVRDVAKNVRNDIASGEAIFEYYDIDGEIYEYDDIEGKALVTTATPSDIRMVKIILYINPEPIFRSPDNVRIQSFVVVRNLTEFDDIPT